MAKGKTTSSSKGKGSSSSKGSSSKGKDSSSKKTVTTEKGYGEKGSPIATIKPASIGDAQTYGAANLERVSPIAAPTLSSAAQAGVTNFTGATINTGPEHEFRAKQISLADTLAARANGTAGPSVAQLQMQQGLDRQNAGNMGLVAALRMRNPGLAARMAMNQGAANQQAMNQQTALLRAQETIDAQNQLAGVTSAGRSADQAGAQAQAALEQQAAAANAAAANEAALANAGAQNSMAQKQGELTLQATQGNQTVQANQAQQQAQLQQQASSENAQMVNAIRQRNAELAQAASTTNATQLNQGTLQREQVAAGIQQAGISAAGNVNAARAAASGQVTAAGIHEAGANYRSDSDLAFQASQGAGAAGRAYDDSNTGASRGAGHDSSVFVTSTTDSAIDKYSDERLKKNVEDGSGEVHSLLEAIRARKFEYKNPKDGKGKEVGVMAQDLEKSEAGSGIVKEGPRGKVIDIGKATTAALASLSDIHKRLRALETKKAA